jgi:hypothetical protein
VARTVAMARGETMEQLAMSSTKAATSLFGLDLANAAHRA